MGKFLDLIESRFRDYRDQGDEEEVETSYPDPLGSHYNDSPEEEPTTQPDPLGNHNQIPEPTEEPTPVPEPEPAPEPEPEPEEPPAETETGGVDAYTELEKLKTTNRIRYDTISKINQHFTQ